VVVVTGKERERNKRRAVRERWPGQMGWGAHAPRASDLHLKFGFPQGEPPPPLLRLRAYLCPFPPSELPIHQPGGLSRAKAVAAGEAMRDSAADLCRAGGGGGGGAGWRAGKARRSTEGARRGAADLGRRRGRKVLGFGWLPLLFISISVRVVESKMNGQDQLGYLG
jgi:hypothetical protein